MPWLRLVWLIGIHYILHCIREVSPCADGNSSSCSPPWELFADQCYRIYKKAQFNEAVNTCKEEGAVLASVRSKDEAKFLVKKLTAVCPTCKNQHIGLVHNDTGHYWMDNGRPLNTTCYPQVAGDGYANAENCIGCTWKLRTSKEILFRKSAESGNRFICQKVAHWINITKDETQVSGSTLPCGTPPGSTSALTSTSTNPPSIDTTLLSAWKGNYFKFEKLESCEGLNVYQRIPVNTNIGSKAEQCSILCSRHKICYGFAISRTKDCLLLESKRHGNLVHKRIECYFKASF